MADDPKMTSRQKTIAWAAWALIVAGTLLVLAMIAPLLSWLPYMPVIGTGLFVAGAVVVSVVRGITDDPRDDATRHR